MDAFVQHLASKKMQLRAFFKSRSDAEMWLRAEFLYLLDYLQYVNRFRNFIGSTHDSGPGEPDSRPKNTGGDIFIRGKKTETRIELAYFSTQWDMETHLSKIRQKIERLVAFDGNDLRIFVEIMVSHGKWAEKAIEDRIFLIQETEGIHFERYSPSLILTLYNEYGDHLEEKIILKLYYSYIP